MAITKRLIAVSLFLTFGSAALADLDAQSTEALDKTQALLKDPKQREAAAAESTKAAATMKSAESFVGKEHTDELYAISADVMATITKNNNGDPKKMTETLQKSPEDFIKFFTPEEMSKIESLTKKIESERK